MRNLLKDKAKYYRLFADDVYASFRKVRYGIGSDLDNKDYDVSLIRKELVDWQSNADNDALTQTSINYYGWLPVTYNSNDDSVVFSSNINDPYRYLKICSANPVNVGLNYNYGVSGNQNLIEVNTGGCVTRINLNPAITFNNQTVSQFTYHQQTAATTWTINHGLGFVPNVMTMDESGQEIMGVVNSATTTTLVIQFSEPVTGYAYLS